MFRRKKYVPISEIAEATDKACAVRPEYTVTLEERIERLRSDVGQAPESSWLPSSVLFGSSTRKTLFQRVRDIEQGMPRFSVQATRTKKGNYTAHFQGKQIKAATLVELQALCAMSLVTVECCDTV